VVAGLCLCCGNLQAQDDNGGGPGGPPPGEPGDGGPGGPGNFGGNGRPGGGFDPAQFQQRMLEETRQSLSLTNADEWAAVLPLVQKVMDARREAGGPGGPGKFGPGGRGRPGEQSSSEQQILQKTLEENAPLAQIKDALAKYRAARKDKQAKLETAQNNLKSVLSVKQEAQAVLLGLLP
jgi:hypothetical protein